jgi:virulence factor Mce-like protein
MSRRRGPRASRLTVGLVALLGLAVVVIAGFTKDVPFSRGFQIQAQFANANGIKTNAPVRIAGVNVGRVVLVEAGEGGEGALVTLEIDEQGLPVHEDATAKIRPRIFLEGNFFVDLRPGSPGTPELADGDVIKVTQTATPVQIDQVLTSLQADTREDFKDVLGALGRALSEKPTAAQDRAGDPSTRGQTAAEAWNDAFKDTPGAFKSTALVNDALLGTEPERDLARLLAGAANTATQLVRDESALKDLISGFNVTAGALAAEEANLRTSISLLPGTLAQANATLSELNAAFPATRAFAREVLPGVRETAATIDAAFPWIEQARALVSRSELGALVADLAPAVGDLARLTDRLLDFLPLADRVAKCFDRVILPTGDVVIRDEFETGQPNYREFFYALVGLAGESQNFDGATQYLRFQTGGGSNTIALGTPGTTNRYYGNAVVPPLGTRPKWPGRLPVKRSDRACYTQQRPDLNGPAAAKGAAESGQPARAGR